MTPLRQRFLQDLQIRNYAPRTIQAYLAAAVRFSKYFGLSPDQLGPEHIRDFQLHLLQQHLSWGLFNQIVCALRFLYAVTLQRPGIVVMIPYGKKPRTQPVVLAVDEVRQFMARMGVKDPSITHPTTTLEDLFMRVIRDNTPGAAGDGAGQGPPASSNGEG